jgi:site-specific DNA recombinase
LRDQLAALINGLGNLLDFLAKAAPEDKAEVYAKLGLRLTYDPSRRVVIAESDPWATRQCRRSEANSAHPGVPDRAVRHCMTYVGHSS